MFNKIIGLALNHSVLLNNNLRILPAKISTKLQEIINNIKSLDDLRKLLYLLSTKTDEELMQLTPENFMVNEPFSTDEYIQEWSYSDSLAPEIKESWHIIKGDIPFSLKLIKLAGDSRLPFESFMLEGSHYIVLSPKCFTECQRLYALNFQSSKIRHALMAFQHFEHIDRKFSSALNMTFGYSYSPTKTTISLWAPKQTIVTLKLYSKPNELTVETEMNYDPKTGSWSCVLPGDLKGMFYKFSITNAGGASYEIRDPEAKACSLNGDFSAILDLNETNPVGWETIGFIPEATPTGSIIYETHIKDFTSDEETNAQTYHNVQKKLDYLKNLGVTHLAFQPLYQFGGINENDKHNYNWGYNPKNWNCVSGAYSSNPNDPATAIRELKSMIMALKEKGIGIVFDAVYNHVYQEDDILAKLFPGYYLMTDNEGDLLNGSYCGNQVASDRAFMRKMIIESAEYWVKEFKADKLRFDLMGLLDVETMNILLARTKKTNPYMYIYGEPWHMGSLPDNKRASIVNNREMSEIGMFNGKFRDLMLGDIHHLHTRGLLSGEFNTEWIAKLQHHVKGYTAQNFTRRTPFANAGQNILYVDCHDNYTFFDKLRATYPGKVSKQEETRITKEIKAKYLLSVSILATSQGVPLLYGGSELLRSKGNVRDSYNSGDLINAIPWENENQFLDVQSYIQKILAIKKSHPAFQMTNPSMINDHVVFLDSPPNTFAFKIINNANGDRWREILIVYNFSDKTTKTPDQSLNWHVAVRSSSETDSSIIKPFEAVILYQE